MRSSTWSARDPARAPEGRSLEDRQLDRDSLAAAQEHDRHAVAGLLREAEPGLEVELALEVALLPDGDHHVALADAGCAGAAAERRVLAPVDDVGHLEREHVG